MQYTARMMELAIVRLFDKRRHLIVPNVSWGMMNHEADMLIIRPSGAAVEVEIKVSISDLKRDADKRHGHRDSRIKHLFFAVPLEILDKALPLIPEDAGIISVGRQPYKYRNGETCYIEDKAVINRKPKLRGNSAFTDKEIRRIAELGVMRYWNLREQTKEKKG